MTVLGLSVCMLIPGVGPIVSSGYMFRRFARERKGHPVEDFDFNHFVEYLKIGVWPFLASLVLSLLFIPLMLVAMVPMMAGPFLEEISEKMALILLGVGFAIYLLSFLVLMLFTIPVILRSGLMMDFKSGFSWKFISSFIKKVGWSLMLYYSLLVIISIPLSLVGYLALIIGIYVVMVWVQLAMMSLIFQHYDLFVHRGGEEIIFTDELVRDYGRPPLPKRLSPPSLPPE